jgi:methyl-accepting chemotaxis protein
LSEIREATAARYAALSIFDEDGQVEKFFTLGMTDAQKERIGRLPQGEGLLGHVRQATPQLSSTSDQIAATTQQMAAGAEEQSAQTEEVASAMEEMSRTVLDNAKTTERTADLAARTERTAEANAEVVRETVAKMNEIGAVVERSVNTVRELGMSSEEIGEIVATIDEIADQTNLLALNAAIEAARAGEHGAGFAVVADEVRELAERTARATARIEEMITGIQAETQRAVAAMDDGQQEVEEGIDLADQAGDALETMIGNVQEVTDDIGEIAAATEQQSTTSEQISHSVNSISTVTGQTAQGVTEIATSADVLADLSDQLVGAIDQFKFQDGVDGRDVQAGDGAVASGAPDALVSTPRTR